jgi:Undecaprenyl-phosphate glucose phosphotransferase
MDRLAPQNIQFRFKTSRRLVLSYQGLQILSACLDVVLLLSASILGFACYQYYVSGVLNWQSGSVDVGLLSAIYFVLLSRSSRFYELSTILNPWHKMTRMWIFLFVTFMLVINTLYLLKVGAEYSRGAIITFGLFAFAMTTLGRDSLSRVSFAGIQRGFIYGKRIVTIGVAPELDYLDQSDLRQFGMEEIARVGVAQGNSGNGIGEKGSAQIGRAIAIARETRATEFVLVIPWTQQRLMAEIGELLRHSPLGVRLFPDHNIRSILKGQGKHAIEAFLAAELQREPLNIRERAAKRFLDLSLSLTSLILLAPLLLIVALAIKLDSKGPVLFRQRRCGFDNREFVILKFRTMRTLDDGSDIVQASRGDARVTRVGRLLRRSSIDELPQLFNVFRGEMSIVGPRPHAMAHHDHYSALIATYALRHHVKPGLTGMAQIRGLRGETLHLSQMEQRVEKDLWYIKHWSFTLDLMIMARTCIELFRQEAY